MTSFVTSATRLPGGSALPMVARSQSMRRALNLPDVIAAVDASEVAGEFAALTLRDLVGVRPVEVQQSTPGTINGTPALNFTDAPTNAAGLYLPMALPADYFLAVAVNIANTSDTSALIAADDLAGDDLFFGTMSTGALRLAHGSAALQYSAGTVTGPRVIWASYRSADGAVNLANNVLTAPAGGVSTIAVPHTATAITRLAGGASPLWQLNGLFGAAIIARGWRGGAENLAWREIVLGALAERIGVSLS